MRSLVLLVLMLVVAAATEWDPEVRLTENDYADFAFWSCQRRVVVDPEGRVHVAWHVMNSGLGTYKFQVYYKRYVPGSGWTPDTMLSADLYASGVYCKYPSLAVDSSGRVHAFWTGGSTDAADEVVYWKSCVPTGSGNGGWDDSSRVLSPTGADYEKGCPNAAATPDGHVHAVWLEIAPPSGRYIAYRERVGDTWQSQVNLEASTNYKVYPSVAGGPDSRVHVVWHGRSGPSGYYDVWYKARTGTVWGPTENVSSGVRHQMYPSIAVNPATAYPHVLWQCYEPTGNIRRTAHGWRSGSGWQPRDTLSEPGSEYNQATGQIAFTADGRGHAVWGGRTAASPSVDQIRYSERSVAGTWSGPVELTDTTNTRERPSIADGSSTAPNDVHVVWSDYRDGNAEYYYCHGSPGAWSAEGPGEWPGQVAQATVVRGVLGLGAVDSRQNTAYRAELLDISGRKVMELGPGENDVGGLPAGVYFVHAGRVNRAQKVVVQR